MTSAAEPTDSDGKPVYLSGIVAIRAAFPAEPAIRRSGGAGAFGAPFRGVSYAVIAGRRPEKGP